MHRTGAEGVRRCRTGLNSHFRGSRKGTSCRDAADRRKDAGFACRNTPPIFFLKHQKENAPCTVEKKKC